ncbi:hypothetical protein MBLNU230_g6229t1 [Neophaeotheca triangularis]
MAERFENEDEDMDDTAGQDGAEAGDQVDDRSSSLSEPEDDDEEEDRINGDSSSLARAVERRVRASVENNEDDSEAETERLEQTPQKPRNRADGTGKTPSKLSQAAQLNEELSDPPSPIPAGAGAASSTSTVAPAGMEATYRGKSYTVTMLTKSRLEQAGQKRKRSADTADSPLTSEASSMGSPRKRNHEAFVEPATEMEEPDGVEQGVEEEPVAIYDKPSETPRSGPASPTKGHKGRKGKQKSRKGKEVAEQGALEEPADSVEQEEEATEEAAAKTEAELQQKEQATKYFDALAQQFAAYRELLYNERIAAMNEELRLLDEPKCEHPEFLRQVAAVDARREKQIREAQAHHFYKMQALRERTLGDRSQLHSQYVQHVRDLREQTMEELGRDWYSIQKERRQSHQEQGEQYQYRFPTKKSEQIRQQAKYNQEVSVLSGVAKYVGFPAAPEIDSVEGDALDDDLKAMKIPKQRSASKTNPSLHQAPQPQPQQARHHTHTVFLPQSSRLQQPINNERLAHEQFIEQNAWARPQMPLHSAHGTPNLTHTPDWAEPQASAKHLMRNISGGMGRTSARNNGSPFQTPVPNKRMEMAASDGPEPPSSVLAVPPGGDRALHNQNNSSAQVSRQGSPLQVSKRRQPHQPTDQQPQGHSLQTQQQQHQHHNSSHHESRNISNISGTSTIDAPLDQSNPPSSETRPSHAHDHDHGHRANPHHHHHHHHHQNQNQSHSPNTPFPKIPLPTESSAPLQPFDTSQMHRLHAYSSHSTNFHADSSASVTRENGRDGGNARLADTYASVGFRPTEGAFGTPVGTPGPGYAGGRSGVKGGGGSGGEGR